MMEYPDRICTYYAEYEIVNDQIVFVKYRQYPNWYKKDEYHCVACGHTPIYVEEGDGDYYAGPTYICPSCGYNFCCTYDHSPHDIHDRLTAFHELDTLKQIQRAIGAP